MALAKDQKFLYLVPDNVNAPMRHVFCLLQDDNTWLQGVEMVHSTGIDYVSFEPTNKAWTEEELRQSAGVYCTPLTEKQLEEQHSLVLARAPGSHSLALVNANLAAPPWAEKEKGNKKRRLS